MHTYKAQKVISPSRSNVEINHSIYTSVKPLVRLCQVLGLAPVAWPDLKALLWGTIYASTLFIAMATWFIYTTILDFVYQYPKMATTFIIPSLFNSSALYVTSLSAIGVSIAVIRNKLDIIMQLVSEADKIVLAESPCSVHKKVRWVTIIQMLILFPILTTIGILDNWVENGRLWNYHDYTGRFVAHIINSVLILQYSSFALLLKHRFYKLNSHLQSNKFGTSGTSLIKENRKGDNVQNATFSVNGIMFKKPLTSVDVLFGPQLEKQTEQLDSNTGLLAVHPVKPPQFDPSEYDENVFGLRKAHAMLCEVAAMVNGMYGFQMLMAMASEFIGTVWLLYCILVAVINSDMSEPKVKTTALCSTWLMYRCLKIVYVVSSCHMAQAEAHRTGVIVQQTLLLEEVQQKQANASKILQLQLFAQQLMHFRHQVNFTACGFFPFNMSLLNSIVGAITTYIIILIQFHYK